MKLTLTKAATLEESVSSLKWVMIIQANIMVILFAHGDILGPDAGRISAVLFEILTYFLAICSYYLFLQEQVDFG